MLLTFEFDFLFVRSLLARIDYVWTAVFTSCTPFCGFDCGSMVACRFAWALALDSSAGDCVLFRSLSALRAALIALKFLARLVS